jgi:hypothetical protein
MRNAERYMSLKAADYLRDLGVDGRMIMMMIWFLEKGG